MTEQRPGGALTQEQVDLKAEKNKLAVQELIKSKGELASQLPEAVFVKKETLKGSLGTVSILFNPNEGEIFCKRNNEDGDPEGSPIGVQALGVFNNSEWYFYGEDVLGALRETFNRIENPSNS